MHAQKSQNTVWKGNSEEHPASSFILIEMHTNVTKKRGKTDLIQSKLFQTK